jgi:uncharacterized oligopeptide transporter (OPT) family protein
VFPAPSAQVWAGVSKLLSVGLDSLAPSAKIAALIGFVLGAVLTLLERYAPKGVRPFVPSPSGIGISVVLPGSNVFMMGLGAIIAEVFRRKKGKKGDELVLPVSAGLIAGESLMGILVAMLIAFGVLSR